VTKASLTRAVAVSGGVEEDLQPVPGQATILVAGLLIWAAAFVLLPAPMAARILLLAPLVVVPRLLSLLPGRPWIRRLAGWPTLLAALPLVIAFGLPAGALAGALGLPWLALALTCALAAVMHGLPNLPSILRPRQLPDLGIDFSLGFLAVAATFTLLDRFGVETSFSSAIVLLTATHFHFAGFGLLGLASLLARSRPWLRVCLAGLVIGIPITAIGFVLVSSAINALGALFVGLSGIGVAIALVTPRSQGMERWSSRFAGTALLIGMPMGIAWSLAILTGQTFLDLETMIRTHGALNATAVLLGVVTFRARYENARTNFPLS
jgi:hypothetical protein